MTSLTLLARVALLALAVIAFSWALGAHVPATTNGIVIIGGVLSTFPVVWLGKVVLERHPTTGYAVWTTTFVHFSLAFTLGVPLIRALATCREWRDWAIPVPRGIGLALVIVTATACGLTVANLALKGLGAPFFIALSRKLAQDWLYARTRNPMALAVIACGLSLGIWLRSGLLVLWFLVLFAPALLFFIRVYEERELEIRFGEAYRLYRASTPFLWPSIRRRTPTGRSERAPAREG